MNIHLLVKESNGNIVHWATFASVPEAYRAAKGVDADLYIELTQRAIAKPWPNNLKQILIKV